jgi:putative drug exporter of the RND superfamily
MRESLNQVLPESGPAVTRHPGKSARSPVTERIAGWSARHRKTAVFGWLVFVALIFVAGQAHGMSQNTVYDPGQAGQAERTLQQLTGDGGIEPTEAVLIATRGSGAAWDRNPALRQAAGQVVSALSRLPGSARDISSPLSRSGRSLIAPGGRSVLVTFTVPGSGTNAGNAVQPALRAVAAVQAAHPGLVVAEAGDASGGQAVSQAIDSDLHRAEETSVPITVILLLLVFGALVAAGIPLLLAITSVISAISLLSLVSGWVPVSSSASEVVLVVGMAVGVDYSLFYLRREREERAAGRSNAEALATAARTSGKAILVSGVTVMIALAGLFLTGIQEFTGTALGTIAVVGIAVVGSLTVLPALLSWLGRGADKGKVPFLGRRRAAARPSRVWAALVRRVVRRPLVWGGVAALALMALALPATGMRLGFPAVDAPASIPEVHTEALIQSAFHQVPAPAEIVVTPTGGGVGGVGGSGGALTGPRMAAAVAALRADAARDAARGGPLGEPVMTSVLGHGQALLVEVPLAGDGTDATSHQALNVLDGQVLPATIGRVPGVSYAVTGDTASIDAFTDQLHDRMALVLGLVGALAFVLLLIAFRSVVIPFVSILLNLLSVAAAYGLVTLIFQDGRLQGLLGYTAFGGIISWVPLFMFVFLFGISMDYHVFILSRIRELRLRGSSTTDAVIGGISSSAGVVTSAALIMVAVFSIFATLSLVDLKILGIGTAAAVLIDATIVRGILMPAALALLGDRTWFPASIPPVPISPVPVSQVPVSQVPVSQVPVTPASVTPAVRPGAAVSGTNHD